MIYSIVFFFVFTYLCRRVEGVSHYPILFAYSKYFIVGHEDDKFDTLAEMVEHYKYLPLSSENDLLLFPEYCRENYGFGDFINMDQVERVRRSAQVRGDRLYAQQLARDETAKAKKKHLERQQQTRSVGPNIGSSRPQPGRTPSTPNIVISDTPNSNLSASTTASTSPSLSHHGSRISVSYNLQGEELNVFLEEVEKINNLIKIETRIFEGAQRLVLSGTQSKKSQKERVKTLMESENHLNALKARLKELESMTSQQRIEWSKAATLQRANFNKVFPTVDDVSPNTSCRNSAIVGGSPGSISPNTSSNNLPAAGGGGGGGQSLNQNLSSPRGRLESLDTSNQVQQLQYGAAQVVGHSALQSPSSSASFASVSSSASFTSTTSSNSIGATNSTTTTTTTSGVEEGKKKKKWAKNNMMAGRGLDNYAPAYVK